MKPLLTLLLAFLLLNVTGLAQPYLPHLKPYLKNGNDTIHFAGDSVRFKIMNVCNTGLVYAFNATSSMPSSIGVSDYTNSSTVFKVVDNLDLPDTINGISGYYGYIFGLYFTSNDSIFYRFYRYQYPQGNIVNESTKSFAVQGTMGLIGFQDLNWIIARRDTTAKLLRVNTSLTAITDSLNLPFDSLISVSLNVPSPHGYPAISHMLGEKSSDSIYYCSFDMYSKDLFTLLIDTIPGNLVYFNASGNGVFLITTDSQSTLLTRYTGSASSTTIVLDSFNAAINAYRWADYVAAAQVAVIYPYTDTSNPSILSIVVTYDSYTWEVMDTIFLNVKGEKIYSNIDNWNIVNYLVYSDSSSNVYMAPFHNNSLNTNYKQAFPGHPSTINNLYICFLGIDDNAPPPIQTYAYPNPSTDRVEVVIKNVPCDMDHYLELVDLQGRRLYETKFVSKCDVTVPVAHLASGMYILKLHIAGRVYTHKLMKQ